MNKTWPIIWPASAVKIFYKKTLLKKIFRRQIVDISMKEPPTKDAGLGAKTRPNRSDLNGREDSGAFLQRRDALLSTA